MRQYLFLAGFLILSYLLAAVPFGFLIVKAVKKEDIRQFGSGNIGATNVARRLGIIWGIFTFLLDFLKGFIPVYAASVFCFSLHINMAFTLLVGIAAICGHNWPVFLKFKGGKGVSTSIGVISALSLMDASLRLPLGIAVSAWILLFFAFRVVALASVGAAFLFFLSCIFFLRGKEFLVLSFLIFAFILLRHRSNFKRLRSKSI